MLEDELIKAYKAADTCLGDECLMLKGERRMLTRILRLKSNLRSDDVLKKIREPEDEGEENA